MISNVGKFEEKRENFEIHVHQMWRIFLLVIIFKLSQSTVTPKVSTIKKNQQMFLLILLKV